MMINMKPGRELTPDDVKENEMYFVSWGDFSVQKLWRYTPTPNMQVWTLVDAFSQKPGMPKRIREVVYE